jgi:hypothetical protein
MPDKETLARAKRDKRQGRRASTQAGELVQEEHGRAGRHGAEPREQPVASGLSRARRAGVELPAPQKGRASENVQKQAERDVAKGRSGQGSVSLTRSRAAERALRRERPD